MPLASLPRSLSDRAEATGRTDSTGRVEAPAFADDFVLPHIPAAPSPTRAAPVKLGPWQLEAVISEGRWSRVCRATRGGRDGTASYALKLLHSAAPADSLSPHAATRLQMLRSEATVGRCVMHPHVSSIVAAHVHQAPYYVVMPLLVGSTAARTIETGGRFQPSFALWIARQIAEGLESLHTLGYVHGDVRCGNIFVGADGHATLLDLSCARRIDADATFDDQPLLGSIESLAPELHVGQLATHRSDLYSLGLAMYHLLAGRLPWRSTDPGFIAAWKTSSHAADVREFAPAVPAAVARFIRSLMSVEPLRRPASARDVAAELAHLEVATLRQRVPA